MYKVYILHGWSYSTEKWEPFLKLLEQKGVEYKMLKIPGLTAPLEQVWNLSDYVDWLKKEADKQNGQVILLGHSNGGRIALGFALKYPQKVSQLILIDSAGIYHEDILLQIKRFMFRNFARLKKIVSFTFLQNLFYKIVREYDYNTASPIMKKVLQNLIESDIGNPIEKISVPTAIIWGEKDNITPLSDGKIMNEKIKNSRLHIIKGAGHSPQFTNTSEVANIITSKLKKNGNI